MSEVLNLFPARIAIGKWRDPDTGKDVPVLMSTEFERALGSLFRRVGGSVAFSNEDIAILTASVDGAAATARADSRVAELERQVATLQSQIAAIAQLAKRLDGADQLATMGANVAIGQLAKRISDAERVASVVPSYSVDWTRPGKIGSNTPNTGAFTAISYSGQLTSTVATGTAPFIVASTTKVSNLNSDLLDGNDWTAPGTIGSVTPGSASFTTINASAQITSTVSTGTAPLVVASTTKVANLNVDLLDGNDWATPAAIGSTTPNSVAVTTVSASGQVTSTVASGTAPFVVTSTTKVSNLNVDLLDGKDWVAPGPIGGTTPDTGAFTSLTTTGAADSVFGLGTTTNRLFVNGSNSGTGGGTRITVQNNGTSIIAIGNKSTIEGGAYDATPIIYANATIYVYQGMTINGDVGVVGKVGFNGASPLTKPSITGSRSGNAALASLLTQLATYGLITDSTTA